MNASDQRKVDKIHDLKDAISKLSVACGDLYVLNFGPLNEAGGNKWAGTQHDTFLKKYDEGKSACKQAPDYIQDMIQEYNRKISNIAWSIEDIPTKLYYGILE